MVHCSKVQRVADVRSVQNVLRSSSVVFSLVNIFSIQKDYLFFFFFLSFFLMYVVDGVELMSLALSLALACELASFEGRCPFGWSSRRWEASARVLAALLRWPLLRRCEETAWWSSSSGQSPNQRITSSDKSGIIVRGSFHGSENGRFCSPNGRFCLCTKKRPISINQLKSAQRDTNLRAGTLQPDRTF